MYYTPVNKYYCRSYRPELSYQPELRRNNSSSGLSTDFKEILLINTRVRTAIGPYILCIRAIHERLV